MHHSSRQKGAERGPSLLLALQGKPPARARVSPFNPSPASGPATDNPPPPKGCSSPAAPSPLTPWSAVAAAATSGPKAPRRFAPGAPPPRTSARPPAKAAAVEAAAVVVAAPPPRPPEPPTRTSPNRGRGGFVTQAGQGWTRACLAHCLRPWSRGAHLCPAFWPGQPPLDLPAEAAAQTPESEPEIWAGFMRRPPPGPIQIGPHRTHRLPHPLPSD